MIVTVAVLIFFHAALPDNQVVAGSGFSLVEGQPKNSDSLSKPMADFWRNLKIEVKDEEGDTLPAHGEAATESQTGTVKNYIKTVTDKGSVDGVYSPKTGGISGTYQLSEVEKAAGPKVNYTITKEYSGKFSVTIKPGDKTVQITYNGSRTQTASGKVPGYGPGEDPNFTGTWGFTVDYKLEGEILPNDSITPAENHGGLSVSNIKGDDLVFSSNGGQTWKALYPKAEIKIQDTIKTGPKTFLTLTYADGSTFRIKPNSVVTILSDGLQIQYGDTWLDLRKNGKRFEVITYTTVAGVLGTTFTVSVNNDVTTLKTIEGSIAFKSKVTGKTETVNTGESMTADKKGLGQKTTFDVAAENDSWKSLQAETSNTTNTMTKIGSSITTYYIIGFVILIIIGLSSILRKNKRG